MKLTAVLLAMVLSLCILSGCTEQKGTQDGDTSSTETGYPEGQVQRELLYYNGSLWGLDFYSSESNRLSALPDGYVSVGKITFEDSYNAPKAELHSAHIAVGTEIYASDDTSDAIYVFMGDNDFRRFVPIEIVAD